MNKRQRKKFAKKYYQKRPPKDGKKYITEYEMNKALEDAFVEHFKTLKVPGVLK